VDLTNYRLTIEYDGTNFAGWQIQPNERTVQQVLEDAVQILFGEHARVSAAGRTDAGVHATGQVVQFRTQVQRTPQVVLRGLNANLPRDVRVKTAVFADTDFHARFSARWRGYMYRIALQPVAVARAYSWQCPFDLDLGPMQAAARQILGSHDFRAFAHEMENETHYLCDVYRAEWLEVGPHLELHLEANRFLHGMVRLLVGTFVNIGRLKQPPESLKMILDGRDVRQAGPKAPACGLTLRAVGYRPWPEQ
jgi:tRNA pseudouridine38-40 synthase